MLNQDMKGVGCMLTAVRVTWVTLNASIVLRRDLVNDKWTEGAATQQLHAAGKLITGTRGFLLGRTPLAAMKDARKVRTQ